MSLMPGEAFDTILALSAFPEAIEDTICYLTEQLEPVLRKNEAVLICFPHTDPTSLGIVLGRSVERCGGRPIFWEKDLRWEELLRLAFLSRASTIIGPPLTVLGLSKLAAYRQTPLSIVNAITTGYPCLDWMLDGIISGLDCSVWGILAPRLRCIVAGTSCDRGRGIHIREDLFEVSLSADTETVVPGGRWGKVVLCHRDAPESKLPVNAYGLIPNTPCSCGRPTTKLVNLDYGNTVRGSLYKIMEELLYWNSILDCRVERTPRGLELEIVYFSGLKLPKFPTCAKLVLRAWKPDCDIPFEIATNWEQPTT